MAIQVTKFIGILVVSLVLALVVLDGRSAGQEVETYPRDETAEQRIITELNRWRIRRGLVPLARNAELDLLALGQARYVSRQIPFTSPTVDFHRDEYGDGIIRRAQLFGWPSYDLPDQVLVSEIAAYFPSVAGAINFWQNSPEHKEALQSPGFREAGVAVLRNGEWLLSFVVLGGRVGVLPVTYDVGRGVLFLSTDRSVFAEEFAPTRVRLLNDRGERLHDDAWLVWSDRLRLPPGATNRMTVIVTDGIIEVVTEVYLNEMRVFPADPLPTPTATPTLAPTSTPLSATFTPRPPTATPVPTATTVGDTFDIVLLYDNDGFTLVNASSERLNLVPLSFVAPQIEQTRTAQWLGRYAEVSLEDFPPNYCMQAWSFQMSYDPPPLPDDCTMMVSGRSILRPGERFWLAGRFTVKYGRDALTTCDADWDQCAFDLP